MRTALRPYTRLPNMTSEPQRTPVPDPWCQGVDRIQAARPSYDDLLRFFQATAEDALRVGIHQCPENFSAFAENAHGRMMGVLLENSIDG